MRLRIIDRVLQRGRVSIFADADDEGDPLVVGGDALRQTTKKRSRASSQSNACAKHNHPISPQRRRATTLAGLSFSSQHLDRQPSLRHRAPAELAEALDNALKIGDR